MKSSSPLASRVLSVVASTFVIISGSARAANEIPTGTISASSNLVKVGTLPTLNWEIKYPTEITNYIDIVPPGKIVPKAKLQADIRILGAGVTTSYANGSHLTFIHTEAFFSYDDASWLKVFAGTNWDVRQGDIVHTLSVRKNRSLRFAGRFWHPNGYWSQFYSSNDGTNNVRVLVNGDTPPTTFPLATAPSLEDFIKPYLDSGGRVRIGPMDAIVMLELTHTDAQATQTGYDLQDMVFLVTFKPQ